MTGERVCMFVLNPMTHDTRVEKEASTLAGAGYAVTIVAAQRPGLARVERLEAAEVVRVVDDPLPTRLARAVIGRLRGARGARARDEVAGPGAVITREAVEDRSLRGRFLRRLVAVHLWLVWRKYLRAAFAEARARPARVWIAHDLETLPVALRAAGRLGGRVLYDSHELWGDSAMARGRPRPWERLERRLIGRADAVVTVSDSIAGLLAERYGIPRPSVVLNAPVLAPAPAGEPVDLRAAAGLPGDPWLALYLGGIKQQRGLEQLIEALAERDDLAVVLLGPGTPSYRAELERLAQAAGTSDRFRVLPPVPARDISRWATGADVGVFAAQATYLSYYHSLPNKLFDYLHAGLPVVVSDFPDMRALVERHDVGRTCDPLDPRDIAAAIADVVSDPARHAELRANASRAAGLYTWAGEGDKLLKLVGELSGSGRKATGS